MSGGCARKSTIANAISSLLVIAAGRTTPALSARRCVMGLFTSYSFFALGSNDSDEVARSMPCASRVRSTASSAAAKCSGSGLTPNAR
ncbi:hypothetical protein [Lysobacter gummosus]|uniref:hypothetical protein n=1 Tax=Lysobacter gummosus TaxID=262324 RepID=UPI00363DD5DE